MKRSTRTGIGAVAAGVVLLIAAVVGFVVVPEHRPHRHADVLLTGVPCPARQQHCILSSAQAARGRVQAECFPYGPDSGDGPVLFNESRQCWLVTVVSGLSRPDYDALKIATWTLAIVGGLLIVMGLIRYARAGGQQVP